MQELAADTFELDQLERGKVLGAEVCSKPIPSESQTGRQAYRSHVARSPGHQGGGNRGCGGFSAQRSASGSVAPSRTRVQQSGRRARAAKNDPASPDGRHQRRCQVQNSFLHSL
jgi:hypothetical protein